MSLQVCFTPIKINDLPLIAAQRKEEGWRFVQMLCRTQDDSLCAVYSYMKDGVLDNDVIEGINASTDVLESITPWYFSAFPFENEAHDLFGLSINNIAIDFHGGFYIMNQSAPMTVISPEQKAAREKAARIAAAKQAKLQKSEKSEQKDDTKQQEEAAARAAKLEKLSQLDPEKAAKVKAALEAKALREQERKRETDQSSHHASLANDKQSAQCTCAHEGEN